MIEMGEVEVAVEAQHQIYDGHRFELDVSPAPLLVGVPARVTVRGWEIEADQTLGSPAGGLELHAELHMPDGVEIEVELTEVGAGVYELGLSPPLAGEYELHVEIEEETGSATSVVAGDPDGEGSGDGFEFELYVPDPALPDADEGGDDGHGH